VVKGFASGGARPETRPYLGVSNFPELPPDAFMSDQDPTSAGKNKSRRTFVSTMAANAAFLVAAGCARGSTAATAATPEPGTNGAAGGTKSIRKFDDSWTKKLGEHRVVFEVNKFDSMPGFAGNLMDSYKEGLGIDDGDMGFVVVLRHGVVTMAMRESAWQKYPIGEVLEYKDREGKPYTANPYAKTVEKLLARGVTFLACNVGLTGAVNMIAKHVKADVATVRADLVAAMHPNVYIQPNGVYALLRAQNVGCAYYKLS
jgi:intracellular sulfur oxidation DsrE/DsrF family protein